MTPPFGTRLPPLYNSLTPVLDGGETNNIRFDDQANYSFAENESQIILLAPEFLAAERCYPILFREGRRKLPVALVGLPGDGNQYIGADGEWREDAYIPAYARRYPFLLKRRFAGSKEFALYCDESAESITRGQEGDLIINGRPTKKARKILRFCEQFEDGVETTGRFVDALLKHDLLMDARDSALLAGASSLSFEGYRIVNEDRLRELSGGKLEKLAKSGTIAFIYAHLFSLRNIERLFNRFYVERNAAGRPPQLREASA